MTSAHRVPTHSRRDILRSLLPSKSDLVETYQRLQETCFPPSAVVWAACNLDDDNVLLAGDDGIIARFDGSSFQREHIAASCPIHAMCRSADERIFGVGWLGLICERTGPGQWVVLNGGRPVKSGDSSLVVREKLPLFDVASAVDGTCWAVGDQGRVVRFDGSLWQEVETGITDNLRSVLPMPDGSILVGGLGGVLLKYKDEQWSRCDSGTSCSIVGMVATSPQEIFAVGGGYSSTSGSFFGCLLRYDGSDWCNVDLPSAIPRLRNITSRGDAVYLVGDFGAAYKIQDQCIRTVETNVAYDLHNCVILGNGLLLCGDGGAVLSQGGATSAIGTGHNTQAIKSNWQDLQQDKTRKTLRGVWAPKADEIFAVGDGGTVVRLSGASWFLESVPTDVRLHAVWGTSPNNVYAVGEGASILHFDGKEWSVCYRGDVDATLLAITGFGPHDIFAVGDNGYALRFNGIHWQPLNTGTQYELYALWGFDADHILAAGGAGVLLRWNGNEWKTFTCGTDNDIFGMYGVALDDIYFCGLSSTIVHFDGNTWDSESAAARLDIHAVIAHSSTEVFAVGSQGTVLRRANNGWEAERAGCDVTLRALSKNDTSVVAVGTDGRVLRRTVL